MAYPQPTVQYAQPAQHTVITTQPAFTTTTIVQQTSGPREWSSGLCDCCDDIKICCLSWFLSNCYYGCMATRMGENCCVGCSGDDAGCVPGGHVAMRTKLRAQHNIRGDICGDCCVMHWCKPCAMCQMAREMDRLGYPPGTC